jgi:predicted amidophosphoribosyltransferase
MSGPQTGRSRAERLMGPSFVARPDTRDNVVIVVDDVVTTGATMRRARASLEAAGARSVAMYAVASTPMTAARPSLVVAA